ncbi:hypothetical protein PG988_006800 [Apiospora saccharicola]
MDHTRCAALHNYLVDLCLAADADGQIDAAAAGQGRGATYFSTHGDAAEAVRSRLHPSLAAFLAAARHPDAPLFYFVDCMPLPSDDEFTGLFDNGTADNEDEPEDSIVRLYLSHMDACDGKGGGGMLYHQRRHLACFFVHPDDTELAFPVDEHPQSWHPLETIFSNWIDLIRLGKVTISPRTNRLCTAASRSGTGSGDRMATARSRAASRRGIDFATPSRCVVDRSTAPRLTLMTAPSPHEPLLTPAAMDAAQIPNPSFARAFLSLARRPRHIRQIAPGLSLPPADPPAFAAAQPFTHLPRRVPQWDGRTVREGIVPPVYLFFSEAGAPPVDISGWRSAFRGHWTDGHGAVTEGIAFPSRVPPGVYSECVVRSEPEATEEGFRLLLPFSLYGAHLSSGKEIQDQAADELFQHGFKPFGGTRTGLSGWSSCWGTGRGSWRGGVWAVGPRG